MRFTGDKKAQQVLNEVKEAKEGKLIVNDSELQGRILEGEIMKVRHLHSVCCKGETG